ncbi:MAG: MOSC domain-containing protein [Solirubrobacteraceae bacterium]
MVTVRRLSITPVKGTRLQEVEVIRLDSWGVRENRRFYLINEQDEMVNSLRLGELHTAVFSYSDEHRSLRAELPGGRVLEEDVVAGPEVSTQFYGEAKTARVVEGPWSDVLSDLVGQPLRLVEADGQGAVDRGPRAAVSLISQASLGRLAEEGDLDGIDARRFRMLVEVDGLDPHAEDAWVGSPVRLGEALVAFEGHAGRCNITTRNPVTGTVDAPTLKILGRYRQDVESTEPLPFGVYGRVVEPGAVRLGDSAAVEG